MTLFSVPQAVSKTQNDSVNAVNEVDTPKLAGRMKHAKSSAVRDLLENARRDDMISLAGGLPSAEGFDVKAMQEAVASAMAEPLHSLQYGLTEGEPELREAIVRLMAGRGANISSSSVLVTTGSQQGIDLIARCLLNPGDTILVERPTYLAALTVLELAQVRMLGVDGDHEGIKIDALDALIAAGEKPKALYLVPTFANPTGNCMSEQRRRELLVWAVRHQVVLIEDDPYSELRFSGEAVKSLLALSSEVAGADQWVVHLSTLSKFVAPGLRVGWMVLPSALFDGAVIIKQSMDLHTSTLCQVAAANYLNSGQLASQFERLSIIYGTRKQALHQALQSVFGEQLQINDPSGGMFLWASISDASSKVSVDQWLAASLNQGVMFVPGSAFYDAQPDHKTLRLSYASMAPERMFEGAKRLHRAYQACQR